MSHLSRAMLLGLATVVPSFWGVSCASSDDADLNPGTGGGDASVEVSLGGTSAGGGSGGLSLGGTGGGSAGVGGGTGGTGGVGATGGGGSGGGSSCNPAFCPSVGSGQPCCQASGDCGVDYGMGNGCQQAVATGGSGP